MDHARMDHINSSADDMTEFKQIFVEYKKSIFAVALSIVKDFDLAEDVQQEVFVKLYKYRVHSDIENVKAWLISVARNTALDYYRKKQREIPGFDHTYFEQMHFVTEDPVSKMVLFKYLDLLDSKERQIVVLKDITGMKHREIAKMMEIPLSTVIGKYRRS